jgi:predicted P-loop ATPase
LQISLSGKGDVSDWIANGGTKSELLKQADATPVWQADLDNWYSLAQINARGGVLNNHANAMLALRHDPAWQGVFASDEMRGQVMLRCPVPRLGQDPETPFKCPTPWVDDNDAQAQEYLQLSGFPQMPKHVVATAISQRAAELKYHPIRDYLKSLEWDGILRVKGGLSTEGDILEPFLVAYYGTSDTAYNQAVGTMFLVSAVARIMEPGCKVDHVPILEGRQGIGKSTSLLILASEAYFSDSLPEVGTKDAMDHLRGKWIIEIAELDAMSRAEDTAFKAFITRQEDKFRPAYGRREIEWPRQCVFVGTTNRAVYLKDETGGRRYWPVPCTSIDLAALKRDRDQIWAEAVHLYRQAHPWHITDPDLIQQAETEQKARFDVDVWHDKITEYVADRELVTVQEIMNKALFIETPKQDRSGQNRVMKTLRHLGWEGGARIAGGRTGWIRQRRDG